MRIKYIKEVGSHQVGTIVNTGEHYGKKMIDKGFAKLEHLEIKKPKTLSQMNKVELTAVAKLKDIALNDEMTKKEMVAAIEEADSSDGEE